MEREMDLNIENYSLKDILNLFKLNYSFKDADVKKAYHLALKTHPDKSGLPAEYFYFFMKAYKIIDEINKFRNKDKIQKSYQNNPRDYKDLYVDNDCETHNLYGDSKEANEIILKSVKSKSREDFNKWFNNLFDEVRIKDKEQDDGYEEWFRNNKMNTEENSVEKISKNLFDERFESHRQKTRSLIKYKGIEEMQSSNSTANSGYGILRRRPENYSSAIFSKLNYEDLKKAHTETVVPVTQQDFENKKKFNTVEEMKQFRGNQNVSAMSIEQSKKYLYDRKTQQDKRNTMRAYELIQQDKKIAESHKKWWSNIKSLK